MEVELAVSAELRVSRVLNTAGDAFLVAVRVACHGADGQAVSFSEESLSGSANDNSVFNGISARF